ncbi:MAG: type II toxin-antitoxin system VapC family toxin [Chthoniobacterales bacterium]
MAFWDTSALIKLYVPERDSDRLREVMRTSASLPTISQFSLAEMFRALWAKEFARSIPVNRAEATYLEFREDLEAASIQVIPFGGDVQSEFDRILPLCYRARPVVPIRTLDGLLLASALSSRVSELVSTDSRMRQAATLLGLHVLPEQPNEQIRERR